MSIRSGVIVAALVGGAFAAGRLIPSEPNVALANQPEGMEDMMASMQPGEHHKVLERFVGTWEGDVEFWFAPGTEAMKSHGTIRREWIMDGRFVIEHVEAESSGMPFKGMGIVGYNTIENKYENVWLENMATWISTSSGTYDAAKKTFTFTGEMLDPQTGKRVKQRSVIDCSTPGREVMSGYCPGPDGKEYKNFSGVFVKKG